MKKIILALLILCSCLQLFGQTEPGYTYLGPAYVWRLGMFRALGIPAGDTPGFIAGQSMRAGQIFYDTLGVDAGAYVWNGSAWVSLGSPVTPTLQEIFSAEGKNSVLTSNDTISFSGNKKSLLFRITPNQNYGDFNFESRDTVLNPEVWGVSNGFGLWSSKTYAYPVYSLQSYRGGNVLQVRYEIKDSMGVNSFGGDFGFGAKSRIHFSKMAGYSGRSLYIGGSNINNTIPSHVSILEFSDGTSTTTDYRYARGWWSSFTGHVYLEGRDTLENYVAFLANGAINPTSRINYYYDFLAGFQGANHGSARLGKHWGFFNVSPLSQNYFGGNVLIGDSNTVASALLNVTSTTKGVVWPRMTTAQRLAITPFAGLMLFDTDSSSYFQYGTDWQNLYNAGAGGGSSALSALIAASAINTIDNTTFAQTWDWTDLAGATALKFNSVSTAAASNLHKVVEITASGANATSAQTTYGLDVGNIHTGTTSINIGARFAATGGATNFSTIHQGTVKVEGQFAGAKALIVDNMGFGSTPKFISFETAGVVTGDINRPSSGGLTINASHATGGFILNTPSSAGFIYNASHATTGKHRFTSNGIDRITIDNSGLNVGVGVGFVLDRTITAVGTTGNQTIDKMAGTVNIAAAGTTVTITNSLVTANSLINVQLRTNDATAWVKNYVPAAGSFVINLGAAATAEVSIHFIVTN